MLLTALMAASHHTELPNVQEKGWSYLFPHSQTTLMSSWLELYHVIRLNQFHSKSDKTTKIGWTNQQTFLRVGANQLPPEETAAPCKMN